MTIHLNESATLYVRGMYDFDEAKVIQRRDELRLKLFHMLTDTLNELSEQMMTLCQLQEQSRKASLEEMITIKQKYNEVLDAIQKVTE